MSSSTATNSSCSSSVVGPATSEDILSHVREEEEAHKLRLRAADRKLEALKARLRQVPQGVRLYLQERMALEKDVEKQKALKQEIERDHQQLLRDARHLVASNVRGREAHVTELFKRGAPPPSANTVVYTTCHVCGNVLEKVVDASVMICPKCGVSEPYLESTRNGLGFNEDVEFVNNTYKRQNHFQEWLNQVQARETAPIPDKVIQKIAWQLHRSGTRRTEDITRAKVRAALKALRLRRYYENISSILCQLTGVKPRRLLKHEEMQLKNMFLVIQKPFERHCPKNRSNFLSYSYILFKFCELTGLDWMLDYFKLLKGNDKLHKQDETFRKICQDLDWRFIPSI